MKDGLVFFRFECGSGPGNIHISPNRVDDGQWHKISVTRRGNSATITLDDQFSASGTAPGGNRELNLDTMVFGGKVTAGQRVRRDAVQDGFVGCMGDMNLDGESLPRSGDGVTSTETGRKFNYILKNIHFLRYQQIMECLPKSDLWCWDGQG